MSGEKKSHTEWSPYEGSAQKRSGREQASERTEDSRGLESKNPVSDARNHALCQCRNEQSVNHCPRHHTGGVHGTIQSIVKESLSDALHLTNQQIAVTIEEEQREQGYKELTDVAAYPTEQDAELPSPALDAVGNLTAEGCRITRVPVKFTLQPGAEPGDVANGCGQRVGSL